MKNKRRVYKGISASYGIVFGNIYKFSGGDVLPTRFYIGEKRIEKEVKFFYKTLEKIKSDIKSKAEAFPAISDILKIQLALLEDEVLLKQIEDLIREKKYNAIWATYEVIEEYIDKLEQVKDFYLKERVLDLKDIRKIIISYLQGGLYKNKKSKSEDKPIIVAKELYPSDIVHFLLGNIKGFILEEGSLTSHSVIIAKSLEIPGIVGCKGIYKEVNNEDFTILDAINGKIIVNPNNSDLKKYNEIKIVYERQQEELKSLRNLQPITIDGKKLTLLSNIELPWEITHTSSYGAEGVGLFRSEYIYLTNLRENLSETDQYEVYKFLIESEERLLTIRLFDFGGDKIIDESSTTDNSFLGIRGARYLIRYRDILRSQITAIYKAIGDVYKYKNKENLTIRISVPFVTDIWEVEEILDEIDKVKSKLGEQGYSFDDKNIEFGIMVEIPSTAIMLENFLKKIEDIRFISIGTNDLIQFMFAIDRRNEDVTDLYSLYQPSLFKTFYNIVEVAHSYGVKVGVCGEIASDFIFAILLLGFGVDELSMAVGSIPYIKKIIRSVKYEDIRSIVSKIMTMDNSKDIEEFINLKLYKYIPKMK